MPARIKRDVDAYVLRRRAEGATQAAIAHELGVAQPTIFRRLKRLNCPAKARPLPALTIPIEGLNYDILEDIRDELDFYLGRATDATRGQLAEALVRVEGIMAIINDTDEDNAHEQEARFHAFLDSRG